MNQMIIQCGVSTAVVLVSMVLGSGARCQELDVQFLSETQQYMNRLEKLGFSGGLLIAAPKNACDALIADLKEGGDVHASVIGEILSQGPRIVVT